MTTIKWMLTLAAFACLPAVGHAGVGQAAGVDSLAVPCPSSPTGFVTRRQVESGHRAFAGCRQIFEPAAPTCNADHTACLCRNEGSAESFLDCSWPLVNHCENHQGCLWVQYPNGDVICYCNVPYDN